MSLKKIFGSSVFAAALGLTACVPPSECDGADPRCNAVGLLGLGGLLLSPPPGRLRSVVFANLLPTSIEVYSFNPDTRELVLLGTDPNNLLYMSVNQATNKIFLSNNGDPLVRELPLSGGTTAFSFLDVDGGDVTSLTTNAAGDAVYYVTATLGIRTARLPGGVSRTFFHPVVSPNCTLAFDSVSNSVYIADEGLSYIQRVSVEGGSSEIAAFYVFGTALFGIPPAGDFIYLTNFADGFLSRFARGSSGGLELLRGGLTNPAGAAIDVPQNTAYVCEADSANPRILRVDLGTRETTPVLELPISGGVPAHCTGIY